jgi:plastocyanin
MRRVKMDKKIPIVVIIFIFAVIIGAYVSNLTNPHTMNSSAIINTTSNSNGLHAIIIIKNGTLNPANLTVKPNTVVEWINEDPNTKYMITSKSQNQGTYLFMSDHLSNGQSFTFKFIGNGTYDYYDMDHMSNNNLTGTVLVE